MAKILLEVVIDTTKGKAGIEELKQQLESVGVSGTKLAEALAQDERALQRLLDRAEPARVAAERLAKAEDLLKTAVDEGKLSKERAAEALDTLKAKYTEHASALASLQDRYLRFAGPAGLAAVAAGWLDVTRAAGEAQLVNAKLAATWTANAGAAGITKERLDFLAASLSGVNGVLPESIKNAEALGLTFHEISGPEFERMIRSAQNMAALFGGDMSSAVERLGRALQNPISGMMALSRAGVTFTVEQQEQIKAMAKAGDELGAQNLILNEVENRMNGVARAVGDTLPGAWDKFKTSIHELKEEIGSASTPGATIALTGLGGPFRGPWGADPLHQGGPRCLRFETLAAKEGLGGAFGQAAFASYGVTTEQLSLAGPALDLNKAIASMIASMPGVDPAAG